MALNIRRPTSEEIPLVVAMVKAMSDESPRYSARPFSLEKTTRLVEFFTFDKDGGGYIAELDGELIGMIAGRVADSLTHDYRFAADVGLYVKPKHRGSSVAIRLVRAWEDWAFDTQGADEVNLGISTGVAPEQTVCIYQRLGFKMGSYGMVKTKEERNV